MPMLLRYLVISKYFILTSKKEKMENIWKCPSDLCGVLGMPEQPQNLEIQKKRL
jgi:hypothetical protein